MVLYYFKFSLVHKKIEFVKSIRRKSKIIWTVKTTLVLFCNITRVDHQFIAFLITNTLSYIFNGQIKTYLNVLENVPASRHYKEGCFFPTAIRTQNGAAKRRRTLLLTPLGFGELGAIKTVPMIE